MTKTAIFDAFGTVVRIGRRTNPYRQLLREGIKQGRRPHSGHAHVIMTLNLELHELAEHLGIRFSEPRRVEIESALQAELNSIEAYPNAIEAVAMLRGAWRCSRDLQQSRQALWRGGEAAFPKHGRLCIAIHSPYLRSLMQSLIVEKIRFLTRNS